MHVVMGPRQVGKSIMVGQFADSTQVPHDFLATDGVNKYDKGWIADRWQEARMKMDARGESERILIIDEIQKLDNWSEQVKAEWDKDTREHRNLKVILLGSSRLLLQKGLEESLAGRFETIRMGYWEYSEMRDAFGMTVKEYIYFGGFPGLAPYIHDEDRWRKMLEDSIISPVLTRDILEIEEIRNPALLRQVFELGSMYSSQELSLTKMQGTMNSGSVPTISSYLKILDDTMLLKPMQKYEITPLKTKKSIPKLQVYNNAFKNRYGLYSFAQAQENATQWGRQFESAVGAHLANRSVLDGFDLLYWRTDRGKECDYVLSKGGRLVAIEVKSGSDKDISGYREFCDLYKDRISAAFIVGPEALAFEDFVALDLNKLFINQ
jgi:predicted AAA+ superfamily ATPase